MVVRARDRLARPRGRTPGRRPRARRRGADPRLPGRRVTRLPLVPGARPPARAAARDRELRVSRHGPRRRAGAPRRRRARPLAAPARPRFAQHLPRPRQRPLGVGASERVRNRCDDGRGAMEDPPPGRPGGTVPLRRRHDRVSGRHPGRRGSSHRQGPRSRGSRSDRRMPCRVERPARDQAPGRYLPPRPSDGEHDASGRRQLLSRLSGLHDVPGPDHPLGRPGARGLPPRDVRPRLAAQPSGSNAARGRTGLRARFRRRPSAVLPGARPVRRGGRATPSPRRLGERAPALRAGAVRVGPLRPRSGPARCRLQARRRVVPIRGEPRGRLLRPLA